MTKRWAWVCLLSTSLFAFERVDEKLAVFLARESLHERFPTFPQGGAEASREGTPPYARFRVQFAFPMPEGYWGPCSEPYAYVDGQSGKVDIDLWRDDAPGDALPNPQLIAERFIYAPKGAVKNPARAIELIQRWLDARRNEDGIDYVYDRLAWAYREDGKAPALLDALNRELKVATNPRARYCIYEELAKTFASRKEYSSALEMWDMARAAVMEAGSHPWFTTRCALPLQEKARVYRAAGDTEKAIECYRLYSNTEYGRSNRRETSLQLGELLETLGRTEEAVEVYRAYIAIPNKHAYALQVKELEAPFHERLKLIDARKRMAADEAQAAK